MKVLLVQFSTDRFSPAEIKKVTEFRTRSLSFVLSRSENNLTKIDHWQIFAEGRTGTSSFY